MKSKIILLNGVSSSGKTTVGKAIQNLSDDTYFLLGLDTTFEMLPEKSKGDLKYVDMALSNLHKLIYNLAKDEANLIVDHLIVREEEIRELITLNKEFEIYFIKIDCDLQIINKREIERGNRKIGLAEIQRKKIDKYVDYDLTIDTTIFSPETNAQTIIQFISNNEPKAMKKMVQRYKIQV
ncbi:TPA: hypothetical protein DCR49_07920 [Candidatus Delongbacteria bacterium]|nr:hypothetical protein [Candidatus Delongbacteria bacterium]